MDDAIDGRADQYALAATAFHLLTGSPPFAHFNPAVVISKHLNESPPRPSDVRPDLTDFDAIFARALSQDPVDRFRRCRDFARALESNGGNRSHVRATTDLRRHVRSPRRRRSHRRARRADEQRNRVDRARELAAPVAQPDGACQPRRRRCHYQSTEPAAQHV